MELRVLRYFLAVAREENITAAANKLHITQPTLSKQLMALEDELGRTLLRRGKRRVTLTEDGVFLKKRAEEILALADKTESDFKFKEELVGGDVRIGAGETEAVRYIARAIDRLHKIYPQIRFHLYSGNSEDMRERLDKGLIDFVLFVGAADLGKYDYLKLPSVDTWGLLMRKDCPLAAKDSIESEDLRDIPILCSRQSLIQNELTGWLGFSFTELNVVGTYNLIYNASVMVEEGIGSALSIDGLINTGGESKLCFKKLVPSITADLVVAWQKEQVFSQAAEKFLLSLQEELR